MKSKRVNVEHRTSNVQRRTRKNLRIGARVETVAGAFELRGDHAVPRFIHGGVKGRVSNIGADTVTVRFFGWTSDIRLPRDEVEVLA